MTTPDSDTTTPDPEQDEAPTPPLHPDASLSATTRWESDGGHLHR